MNEWMKVLISLSISGSMIGLLILLLQTIFKEKFSKTWQYYIWIVVIARLLIPFSTDQNLTDMLYRKFDARMQLTEQQAGEDTSHKDDLTTSNAESITDNFEINPYLNGDYYSTMTGQQAWASEETYLESNESISANNGTYITNHFQTLLNKINNELSYLWFLIAVLLFMRKVTNYYGYVRYIKAGCKEIYDDLTISIYMDVCREQRIKKPLRIYVNALSASASLVGVMKRFIVLPSTELTEDELYFIFKHELIHHKRNDIFYKWIVQFTACIHWFNPLVYLMINKHDKLCELSCDESVIRELNSFEIRGYGDTLLSTIKINGSFAGNVTSLTLNEDAKLIKERLVSIMNFTKNKRSVLGITLLVTGGFIFGAVFAGAYSSTNQASAGTSKQTILIEANEWNTMSEASTEQIAMEDYDIAFENGYSWEDYLSRGTNIIQENIQSYIENYTEDLHIYTEDIFDWMDEVDQLKMEFNNLIEELQAKDLEVTSIKEEFEIKMNELEEKIKEYLYSSNYNHMEELYWQLEGILFETEEILYEAEEMLYDYEESEWEEEDYFWNIRRNGKR